MCVSVCVCLCYRISSSPASLNEAHLAAHAMNIQCCTTHWQATTTACLQNGASSIHMACRLQSASESRLTQPIHKRTMDCWLDSQSSNSFLLLCFISTTLVLTCFTLPEESRVTPVHHLLTWPLQDIWTVSHTPVFKDSWVKTGNQPF